MKTVVPVLLLTLFLPLFYSCQREDDGDPYEGRIKRVKSYRSVQDTTVVAIEEYKYDSKKRLEAIEGKGCTVKFEYNDENQLIGKYYIFDDPGWNDTITYLYKDGKLMAELQKSNIANRMNYQYMKTVYEYENARMVKMKKYRDDIFEGLTVYEYKNDLVDNESFYNDSLELHLQTIKSYYYDEQKNLSFITNMSANSQGMAWVLSIYYFYNQHGDLDMEYLEQSDNISAGLTYCKRYEYY